jgi:hypothetical protein
MISMRHRSPFYRQRSRFISLATKFFGTALLFGPMWFSGPALADGAAASPEETTWGYVRPDVSFGYSSTYGGGPSGWGFSAGARFMLTSGASQSFGLEASYVVPVLSQSGGRYLALGIVLEQRIWESFILGIGTVGYVAVTGPSRQPFGIVTNIGWSPPLSARFRPFITYRAEWIFASPTLAINSLSIGLAVNF